MKNKLVSLIALYGFAYVLPLVGQLRLLATVQIMLLSLVSASILVTQPPLSIEEARADQRNDRFSTWVIAAAYVFCQGVSVAEWGYYRYSFHPFLLDWIAWIGLFLIVIGMSVRIWSIRVLGKYFTATVQIQANQQIVKIGAYRIVRHPSYLGAYLVVVASALLLHAYVSLLISSVVMLAAYHYRIEAEEATLVRIFGRDYAEYQSKTKRMFPLIY